MNNLQIYEKIISLSDIYDSNATKCDNGFWERAFGIIVSNRVEGIIYKKFKKANVHMGALGKSFEALFQYRVRENALYEEGLMYLCKILSGANFKYALLKGAFLIPMVYERGERYSNDIDILVDQSDLDECQKLLVENGFVQGMIKNGTICPADRREIIMSRMNYGETIPFHKILDGKEISVDINFSLDFKPTTNEQIIRKMLDSVENISWNGCIIKTLNLPNFIIHLCMHLYKEATTVDWVKRRKDLSLYKFNDLYVLFHKLGSRKLYLELASIIIEYKVQRECYYALLNSSEIYVKMREIDGFNEFLESINPGDVGYLKQIVNPQNKKIYLYNMTFLEWLACTDRMHYLEEYSDYVF